MDLVDLTRPQIDKIFAQATSQHDYFGGLYKLAFPEWDRIKKLDGWPKVSENTQMYIFDKAIQFDKAHHPDVLPGGLWMSRGFGVDNSISDWMVRRCGFTLR